MNQVINTFINHRSIRKYKEEMLRDEDIDNIIRSAQMAPSSNNGQHASIISITDKETKAKIAELCGGQPWINQAPVFLIFVSDFYRAKLAAEKNEVDFIVTENLDSIMVGCLDVGLAMSNAIGAAESLGLGTVPIGAVRAEPSEIVKLLDLPEYVFPICGLALGYPDEESATKPRLPMDAIYHKEVYNKDLMGSIDKYDTVMSDYMKERTNGRNDKTWTESISKLYQNPYAKLVSTSIIKQGYQNK